MKASSFHDFAKAAGVPDRTYYDLRGTAVVRFALAGPSVLQIMAVTGHSLSDVKTIFETHYLLLDESLADKAIEKREASAVFLTDLVPSGTIDIAFARNPRTPCPMAQPPSQLPPTGPIRFAVCS